MVDLIELEFEVVEELVIVRGALLALEADDEPVVDLESFIFDGEHFFGETGQRLEYSGFFFEGAEENDLEEELREISRLNQF